MNLQRRRIYRPLRNVLLAAICVVIAISLAIRLDKLLFPLSPLNPLQRDITVGEKVVGNWTYGGITRNNRMQFFNRFYIVTLPITATQFAGDGDFVVIDKVTPTMLTVRDSRVYIGESSFPWLVVAFLFVSSLMGIWYWKRTTRNGTRRIRRRTRPRTRLKLHAAPVSLRSVRTMFLPRRGRLIRKRSMFTRLRRLVMSKLRG